MKAKPVQPKKYTIKRDSMHVIGRHIARLFAKIFTETKQTPKKENSIIIVAVTQPL